MPPVSNSRKASLLSNDPSSSNQNARRTQSGRAIRTNTTRPANYYARPFGTFSVQSPAEAKDDQQDPPGFFPAIQYFSDAAVALPKEVMRQFTLMKDVEAKVHGPTEKLEELVDNLLELPVPTRRADAVDLNSGTVGKTLTFSAVNSAAGSANASVINGVTNANNASAQNSVAGSINGEDIALRSSEEDLARRKLYHDVKVLIHQLIPNVDEKNVVLAEANRVLDLQLSRMEDVWPYVEAEIPEEARLGSLTHWAYSDNRQKKVAPAINERNRRDVGGTNALAAAANAIHETEIAAARREANREATRERHRGRQPREHVDSDFDDKPRKLHPKTVAARAKAAAAAAAAAAAQANAGGITNGEQPKRRKVDKGLTASGMERTASGKGKALRETPTASTPVAAEPTIKKPKTKPAPLSRKKGVGSAANSPALASSPLHSSFNPGTMEPPTAARPGSARLRQNSSTNLRHEKAAAEEEEVRPTSAAGKVEKGNGKRKAPLRDEPDAERPVEMVEKEPAVSTLKREEVGSGRNTGSPRPAPSRATSKDERSKGQASDQNSKTSTPHGETFPENPGSMLRTRSTRSAKMNGQDSSNEEEVVSGRNGHKKMHSNSHILKQLAPYNKSPDMDRHRKDDMDDELESDEVRVGEGMDEEENERRGRTRVRSKSNSAHNSGKQTPIALMTRKTSSAISPPPESEKMEEVQGERIGEEEGEAGEEHEVEDQNEAGAVAAGPADEEEDVDVTMEDAPAEVEAAPRSATPSAAGSAILSVPPSPLASPVPEAEEDFDEEDDEEGSEHDPDDPNEPRYCYCQRGSYGEMVACDNDGCPREWFHLGCTELREAPGEEEVWYCRDCRPKFVKKRGGRVAR